MKKGNYLRNYSIRQNDENRKLLISNLNIDEVKDNCNILDIGCGDGQLLYLLKKELQSKNDVKYYGLDISLAENKYNLNMIKGNCEFNLPIKNNSIDLVLSNQVLEHLINTDDFFSEINRIMAKDGVAVVSTANLSSIQNVFFILLGLQPLGYHTSRYHLEKWQLPVYGAHVKLFNIQSLKDISKYHGFKVVKTYGSGLYPFPILVSNCLSKLLKPWCSFITVSIKNKL